jgi:hypothetical protein
MYLLMGFVHLLIIYLFILSNFVIDSFCFILYTKKKIFEQTNNGINQEGIEEEKLTYLIEELISSQDSEMEPPTLLKEMMKEYYCYFLFLFLFIINFFCFDVM